MGRVEKITIAVTPDQAQALRAAVAGGGYASTSEVVREALREWRERRDNFGYTVEDLRRLGDEGEASGFSDLPDMDAIKAEARRRFQTA